MTVVRLNKKYNKAEEKRHNAVEKNLKKLKLVPDAFRTKEICRNAAKAVICNNTCS